MSNRSPLVSIVTPVFNGAKYLEDLITSVLKQDYSPIEHIIIDDGSKDDGATVAILKRYPQLRWWSRPNKGAYATMNEGLAAATGDLVTFICADDKYATSTAISSSVKLWESGSQCDAVYGDTITVGEDGLPISMEGPRSGPLWLLRYYTVVAHCSLLVRRQTLINKQLFFDVTFPYGADYDWIMRLIRERCRFKRLRQPVAMFRHHPMQRSSGAMTAARREEYCRLQNLHGKGNPVIRCAVQQWVRLVMLRNLFFRRGVVSAIQEYRALKKAQNTKCMPAVRSGDETVAGNKIA